MGGICGSIAVQGYHASPRNLPCATGLLIAIVYQWSACFEGMEHLYLKEGPAGLLATCDILLSLDDGSQLPAHSQVLARCSSIFHGLVEEGILSKVSSTDKVVLPFSDCSRQAAVDFLVAIYSLRPYTVIDETSALSTVRLAHKYGVKVSTRWLHCSQNVQG